MQTFHELLGNVEELINQGKHEEAKAVLSKHLEEEHKSEAALSETLREFHAYQQNLVVANRFLGTSSKDKALESIQDAKKTLFRAETQLGEMVGQNKLTLRRLNP